MTLSLERITATLQHMRARNERVVDGATLGNTRRLRWLAPVILLVDLLLLLVYTLSPDTGSATQVAWKHAITQVFVVMPLVLAGPALAAWWLGRGETAGAGERLLQFVTPLCFVGFTVALTTIDQWVTPNISPYLLGCLTVSLLFLLRPLTALGLFALCYLMFFVGIGWTQADPNLLLTNRANGFGATLLAFVFSQVLWHKNTQNVLLQRELQARNRALETQQSELLWLATRDTLTGLYNRGEFWRLAEKELQRAQRYGGHTSAIVVDLDHFKQVNDRYGHPAGDSLLQHAAECLRDGVRGTDVVGRIGGEEFMVLLPQTDIDAAARLAAKLRQNLQRNPARAGSDLTIPLTASFGVGSLPGGQAGTAVAALYAAADNALYEAKRKGRNRVERTEPDATLTPSDFQRMRRQ